MLTTFFKRLQREEQEKECASVENKNRVLSSDINEMRKTHASLNSEVDKLTVDTTSLENKLVTN